MTFLNLADLKERQTSPTMSVARSVSVDCISDDFFGEAKSVLASQASWEARYYISDG